MAGKQFQMNLDALRTVVVVITNDNTWTVKRDDSIPTAMCDIDNKVITLTVRNIPDGLPLWKQERLLDGEVAHEAGHPIITGPYQAAYKVWRITKKYPNLAQLIANIYEDLRVNFYITNRYRFSYGGRLAELHRINAKSMVHYAKNLPLTTKRLEKSTIALALLALTDNDVTKGLDSEAKEVVRTAATLMKRNKFKRVTKDIIATVDTCYDLMETLVKRPRQSKKPEQPDQQEGSEGEQGQQQQQQGESGEGQGQEQSDELDAQQGSAPGEEGDEESESGENSTGEEDEEDEDQEGQPGSEGDDEGDSEESTGEEQEDWDGGEEENYDRDLDNSEMPTFFGGEKQLTATKDEIEKAEEEQRKREEEAKKALEELAKEQQQKGMSSGFSTGVEEPHPPACPDEYRRLVVKNTPYITRLLNRLKMLQEKQIVVKRFARHGNYMVKYHGLFKALSNGKGKPFERRYEGRKIELEKVRAKMGILVDMSGSMDVEQTRDALTVIAETSGRWLASDDFSIGVFGTNHALVKAFIEPYTMSRTRIGGVRGMGSTNLSTPLEKMTRMLASYNRSKDRLILIIVSDFWVDNPERAMKLIEEAQEMGILVIGCGLCDSDLEQVKAYTSGNSTYVNHISELPLLFFNVYRGAVSGRL